MTEKKPTLDYVTPDPRKPFRFVWHWWYVVVIIAAGWVVYLMLPTL